MNAGAIESGLLLLSQAGQIDGARGGGTTYIGKFADIRGRTLFFDPLSSLPCYLHSNGRLVGAKCVHCPLDSSSNENND